MSLLEFIFLGTGTSSNVPNISCLSKESPTCSTCISANLPLTEFEGESLEDVDDFNLSSKVTIKNTMRYGKNRRRNTMGLLRYQKRNGEIKNILIDAGKTFYNAALEWFPFYKLRNIDAVLLTHGHCDAFLGLDDLRGWTHRGSIQDTVEIFCNQDTYKVVQEAFPYLVDTQKSTGGGDVPNVKFNFFEEEKPFLLFDELLVEPIKVVHGKKNKNEAYYNVAFKFNDFFYCADANEIPNLSRDRLKDVKAAVIDCLNFETHLSHFGYNQSLSEILKFPNIERGYFTGFSHSVDQIDMNLKLIEEESLKNRKVRVRAAFDGLKIIL